MLGWTRQRNEGDWASSVLIGNKKRKLPLSPGYDILGRDMKPSPRPLEIGINKCARESGFHRANVIRKLVRGIPVKRNSYNEFGRWLTSFVPER